MRILVERLLLDLGGLADLIAEVVQLSAANGALARDFDLVDLGGMHREGALDAHAEADLADREGLAVGRSGAADDGALEDLDAFAVALGDAIMDLDRIAHIERGDVLVDLLLFKCADDIHVQILLYFAAIRIRCA